MAVPMMNRNYWQHVLPPWPVIPPRLWLTGAGVGLAILSLVFGQEIWPAHPQAERWALATLILLMQMVGIQAIVVLCRWPSTYAGPGWMRLAMRSVAAVGSIGIGIILVFLLLLSCRLLPGDLLQD